MEFLTNTSNIALIVVGFGLLIAIHEFGHFLAARWAGIRVESFAVGMGPTVLAFRRGLGVRFGSTAPLIKTRFGSEPEKIPTAQLHAEGVGETEYSLRLLPIGGFVRMKGQEDLDPNASSHAVDGYGSKPVWKRMIVVSAGVVCNLITAVALFVIAFLIGVRFEAPMIGAVRPASPAASARSLDGGADGLLPGDRIDSINEELTHTFADIQIDAAMSRPEHPLRLQVTRAGQSKPLAFEVAPTKDGPSGLLSLGVSPARGGMLADQKEVAPLVESILTRIGLSAAGVTPGSVLAQINGAPISNAESLDLAFEQSGGKPVSTTWILPSDPKRTVTATIAPEPQFERLFPADPASAEGVDSDLGLIGLSPLVRINTVQPESPNQGLLKSGDIILSVDDRSGPRMDEFRARIQKNAGRSVSLKVLRGAETLSIDARVDRQGRLDVLVGPAWNLLVSARAIDQVLVNPLDPKNGQSAATPVAPLELRPCTRIVSLNDIPLDDWASFRDALWVATADALGKHEAATLSLAFQNIEPGSPVKNASVTIGADAIERIHKLGWTSPLPSELFEPEMITRSANGNPLLAASMGFTETKKLALLTWLTLDRLARGTVGVEQLRGPVGIVHVGTRVADRGMTYLLFFLAMISVNLAVLNFLPLPIVDGGLFLFLAYEGFFRRPPSVRFQNAATFVGLAFLGGLFVVTFYNDVIRLFSGS
ncbi:MAG: site-2 protease family protein [Planctomycetes bacterium]|nr:site-2 protease family protein [Planctomycetota bacterium]